MQPWKSVSRKRPNESGMTLFMVAASLFVLLGMAALSIDLVSLYVARSEAQRAADSAALAAAKRLVEDSYFSGAISKPEAEANALEEAQSVGPQNLVGGQPAAITDVKIDFDTNPNNPTVSVRVQRTLANGNPMPTFFAKAIGFDEADIAAVATAEAYTPGNGGPSVCTGCLKPWIMPNCDPNPAHWVNDPDSTAADEFCATGLARYIDSDGNVISTGLSPSGVVGQLIAVKSGLPSAAPAASQFYPIQMSPGTAPSSCPSCASGGGGSSGPGAALYRQNISCCNTNQFYCNQNVEVDEQTGNVVGPTGQGVRCLINQGNGNSGGQDIISFTDGVRITAGSRNPLVLGGIIPSGASISSSSSKVTIPLYDGHALEPGESGGLNVTIIGFLELFIEEVRNPNNTVDAYILNISGCGSGGGGGAGTCSGSGSIGTGGNPIPVRLIQNPDPLPF